MYLLISPAEDLCSRLVAVAMRQRGHRVETGDPLLPPAIFRWAFDGNQSDSRVSLAEELSFDARSLEGVFVRTRGGPWGTGWSPADLAYVAAETRSALLAWLWSLDCNVVNRPTPDVWFRPVRPFPEWQAVLTECGLPVAATLVTNDVFEARHFAEQWGGAVTYTPLGSSTRYRVATEPAWAELAKVAECLPICLVEPVSGSTGTACLVGSRVVWDGALELDPADHVLIERGLKRFGARLGLDVVEVGFAGPTGSPRCLWVDVAPPVESYGPEGRHAIVDSIVELLERGAISVDHPLASAPSLKAEA